MVATVNEGELVSTGRPGRVLVVGESDRTARTTATLASAFPSSALSTAGSSRTAADRLDGVDCVVCEIDGDPATALDPLRERAPAVPILALASEDAAVDALDAGATDVVYADEPDAVVVTRVRNAVHRSRLERRPTTDAGRYQSLLDATSAPVLLADEEGRLEWAGPAIERWTDFTPDELEHTPLVRLVHPDDRDSIRSATEAISTATLGATRRVQCRLRRRDETWRASTLVFVNRLADPFLEGVVVTVQDTPSVSARRDAVIDAIDRPVFALGPDWEVTVANDAARQFLGRDVDAVEGLVVWDLLPEAVTGDWYERLQEARETGSAVEFEVDDPPDGDLLVVGAYPSAAGTAVTVSERDAAEFEPYRDRIDLYEATLDAVEEAVLVVEDGLVVVANAAAFELTDADVVVGRSLRSLFDEDLAARIEGRASSPVRRLDPIEWTIERDAESVRVAVTVVPLDDGRSACVVRDVTDRDRIERTLESLSTAIDGFYRTETAVGVYQTAAEMGRDVLQADHVVCYRQETDAFRPVAVAADDPESLDPPTIPTDESPLDDVLEEDAATILDRFDALSFGGGTDVIGPPITVSLGDVGVLVAASSSQPFDARDLAYADVVAGTARIALDRIEREAVRRDRERELTALRDRCERLSTLIDCHRAVDRLFVEAERPDALARGVCAELSALDRVDLAWIGEPTSGDEVAVLARAGSPSGYVDDVVAPADAERDEPVFDAITSRTPRSVDTIALEGPESGWRRSALEYGLQSVEAVPIVYDGFVYGALGVYSDRPAAFDDPTRRFLEDLGVALAAALNAADAKRALLADEFVELELDLGSGADELLSSIARRTDGEITLETVVPRDDGRSTVLLAIAGADDDAVIDAVEEFDRVETARILTRDGDELRVEVRVEGPTVAEQLADHGGVVRAIDAVDDRARLFVELPSGANVRSFVDAVRETHPGTELLARRGRRHARPDVRAFRTAVDARLTDRQLEILRTAYFSGFFEWPRERTGEEVAESLGISQPTFNRHFRAAERSLFELLFEERRAVSR